MLVEHAPNAKEISDFKHADDRWRVLCRAEQRRGEREHAIEKFHTSRVKVIAYVGKG